VTLRLNGKRGVALTVTALAVVAWTVADVIYPNPFRTWIIVGGFAAIFVGAGLSFIAHKDEKRGQLPK
jgi:hypothetical protein